MVPFDGGFDVALSSEALQSALHAGLRDLLADRLAPPRLFPAPLNGADLVDLEALVTDRVELNTGPSTSMTMTVFWVISGTAASVKLTRLRAVPVEPLLLSAPTNSPTILTVDVDVAVAPLVSVAPPDPRIPKSAAR